MAQANLQANIAAGRGNTFAYTGAAGTSPLPIFLAYLNGSKRVGRPTRYTGTRWTNTHVRAVAVRAQPQPVQRREPDLRQRRRLSPMASPRACRSNFFVANPDVSHANVVANGPDTQLQRHAAAAEPPLLARASVCSPTTPTASGYQDAVLLVPQAVRGRPRRTSRNSGGGSATGNVRHVWSANWVYELPFGRGKHFGSDANGLLDRLIGGWNFQGVARIQSGRMVDFGNVRLVGMTRGGSAARRSRCGWCTDPHQPVPHAGLHAAAGHHRQHDQGVQRRTRPATARARRPAATSRRRTVRTASRPRSRRHP